MIGRISNLSVDLKGNAIMTVTLHDVAESTWKVLQKCADEHKANIRITRVKKDRSLNANSYMWVLCERIADAVNSTRKEIYCQAVRECGPYVDLRIDAKAVNAFRRVWHDRGIGWTTDLFDAVSTESGAYVMVRAYYGSSTYDTKQMSRIIDFLVTEAKDLGLETMTPDELNHLKAEWEGGQDG